MNRQEQKELHQRRREGGDLTREQLEEHVSRMVRLDLDILRQDYAADLKNTVDCIWTRYTDEALDNQVNGFAEWQYALEETRNPKRLLRRVRDFYVLSDGIDDGYDEDKYMMRAVLDELRYLRLRHYG